MEEEAEENIEQETEEAAEQEPEEKPGKKRTWKLTVAAAFILSAVLWSGDSRALAIDFGVNNILALFILVILPVNACWGAYTRKMRNWTIIGAACSMLSMPLVGIPALILVLNSWHEFKPRVPRSDA